MAKINLKVNEPFTGSLKYPNAKFYPSNFPGSEGAFMYSLQSGDVIFLEEKHCDNPDEMFRERRIAPGDDFTICLRKVRGATYYELARLPGQAEQPTRFERQLRDSIDHARNGKAQRTPIPSESAAPSTASAPSHQEAHEQPYVNALATVGHAGMSKLLAGCMLVVIDATTTAAEYAKAKGIPFHLGESSFQDLVSTVLIHTQRMAEMECRYGAMAQASIDRANVDGGVRWRQ